MRHADEDTSNSHYLNMRGMFMQLYVQIAGANAYATPELLAIPDEVLEGFYKACPALELYRRSLDRERARREHTLSDAEEKIMASVSEVCGAPDDIGSILRDADLRFPNVTDSEGKEYQLEKGKYKL
jgi:oligoendopeptidase F